MPEDPTPLSAAATGRFVSSASTAATRAAIPSGLLFQPLEGGVEVCVSRHCPSLKKVEKGN